MFTLLLLFIVLTPHFGSAVFCYECNARKNKRCSELETNSLPGAGSPSPFPSKNPDDTPIYAYHEDGAVFLQPRDIYICPPGVKIGELREVPELKFNNCTRREDLVLLVNCSFHHQQDQLNTTSFFCRKLHHKLDQEEWIVRKCGWLVPEDAKSNCKYVTSFDGKARTMYCSCNGERCNMANTLLSGVNLVTIVLVSLLSIAVVI